MWALIAAGCLHAGGVCGHTIVHCQRQGKIIAYMLSRTVIVLSGKTLPKYFQVYSKDDREGYTLMPSHRNECLALGVERSVGVNPEIEGGVINWSIIVININKETIVLHCTILVESDQCINNTK